MADSSFLLPLAFLSSAPARSEATQSALILFVVLGAALAAFFVAVVLLTISRRRASGARPAQPSITVDAWKTAGERAQPLDGGPSESP